MSENIKMTSLSFKKDYIKPDEERDRSHDFVKWSKKNDYPYFLIDLFNGSAWHQGIIKNKVPYIAGGGLETTSGNLNEFIENKYSEFDMNEISEMLAFDYEGKEILVPIKDEIITEFERTEKRIKTKLPEGLLDVYLNEKSDKKD